MRGRHLPEVYVQGASHELFRAGQAVWRRVRAPGESATPGYVDHLPAALLRAQIPHWNDALRAVGAEVLQASRREADGWWYPLIRIGLEFKPKTPFASSTKPWASCCTRLVHRLTHHPDALHDFLNDLQAIGRLRCSTPAFIEDCDLLERLSAVVALIVPFTVLCAGREQHALTLYHALGQPNQIELNVPTFLDLPAAGLAFCDPNHLRNIHAHMEKVDGVAFLEYFILGKIMSDCSIVVDQVSRQIYVLDTGSKVGLAAKFEKWAREPTAFNI